MQEYRLQKGKRKKGKKKKGDCKLKRINYNRKSLKKYYNKIIKI